jgi:hypothetical protein
MISPVLGAMVMSQDGYPGGNHSIGVAPGFYDACVMRAGGAVPIHGAR